MEKLASPSNAPAFMLRYRSIFNEGRGYAFPCDATGRVEMDSLSKLALNNYLYARTVVGCEFLMPSVEAVLH